MSFYLPLLLVLEVALHILLVVARKFVRKLLEALEVAPHMFARKTLEALVVALHRFLEVLLVVHMFLEVALHMFVHTFARKSLEALQAAHRFLEVVHKSLEVHKQVPMESYDNIELAKNT